MSNELFEHLFLALDATFATLSAIVCIAFFIKYQHPIRRLFIFLAPFFLFVAGGFWLRAFGFIELTDVSIILRPVFAIIFLSPALFYVALKDTLK